MNQSGSMEKKKQGRILLMPGAIDHRGGEIERFCRRRKAKTTCAS